MTGERTPILVVDDQPANLVAVEAVLEPLDLDIVTARSGEDALRTLLHETFALILLDIQMPELDGFETARLIKRRARTRNIPIIFLTALDHGLDRQIEGYASGAVDFLSKPFDPRVLRSKVAVFVDLHRQAGVIEEQRAALAARLAERDAAEAALRAQAVELARSNAELERFAAVAAHALQEPLDVVAGLVELAADRLDPATAPDQVLALGEAGTGLRGARAQLDDLLAYAEAGTKVLHVVPVDLGQLVDEVVADHGRTLDAVGARVTSDPLPVVPVDRWQLGLVLTNLLDNAIRFRAERPLEVHVGLSRVGERWAVSVTDNGVGIDPGGLATLFTAFGSRDADRAGAGVGVGLALCRRIVERHGGAIEASSVVGQGTTITLHLPVAADVPASS